MSWGFQWRPYVPVASRRANAAREASKLERKGRKLSPVSPSGHGAIARTFWGRAWCEHLESHSDFANRLPRGRTYLRNGSVIDLQIDRGRVTALVSGSSVYEIDIKIKTLALAHWKRIKRDCAGTISSMIDLLQGRLSGATMAVVTHREMGLFPKPSEMSLDCSCPDWANMCKHVAAVLYGVGARLDQDPSLLFRLRGVDHTELISAAAETVQQATAAPRQAGIPDGDLANIFGIDLDSEPQTIGSSSKPAPKPKSAKRKRTARRPLKPKPKRKSRR